MADFKFTQTATELQNEINKMEGIMPNKLVLTDVAQTISAIKTYTERQTFNGGFSMPNNKSAMFGSFDMFPQGNYGYFRYNSGNIVTFAPTYIEAHKDIKLSSGKYLTDGTNTITIANIESKQNKVTSVDANSTDTQYASAKCLYTNLQLVQNAKLNVASGNSLVYINNASGIADTMSWTKSADANTFAVRDSNGVLNVGTPTADGHASTKKYVDDADAVLNTAISNEVTARGNAVTSEATARGNADTQLQQNITAEANARVSADNLLQTQINNLKAVGRFLSFWNANTGVANTNPPENEYTYHTGDYFRVGTAGYRIPNGATYVIGGTNYITVENEVSAGSIIYYDGTNWTAQTGSITTISISDVDGLEARLSSIESSVSGKQNALSATQLSAVNSGITSSLVADISSNTNARHTHSNKEILDTLTDNQTALDNKFSAKANSSDVFTKSQTIKRDISVASLGQATSYAQGQGFWVIDANHTLNKLYHNELVNNVLTFTEVFDFNNVYNKTEVDTALSGKQPNIDATHKLSASYVSGLSTVATTGAYSDLSGKPTNVSAFTNDAGYLTSHLTSINGLSGGTLTSPLQITGGSANNASIRLGASGQIIDDSTNNYCLMGRNSGNILVGAPVYPLKLRGSATRPVYNDNNLAMYSDIPLNVSQLANDAGYITSSSLSSYLPKSGGTMTGGITFTSQGSMWNTANIKDTKGSTIGFNTSGQIGINAQTDSSVIDNAFTFRIAGNNRLRIGNTNIRPETTNSFNCGTSSAQWNGVYGKTIYQNGSQVENKGKLTVGGTAYDIRIVTTDDGGQSGYITFVTEA